MLTQWDHSTRQEFYNYYAEASVKPQALARFRRLRDSVLRVAGSVGKAGPLDVADLGCGAGTLSMVWAEAGHSVSGIDINEALLGLARQRASTSGAKVKFFLGSATELPWPDGSMDICCAPELLEHVPDWERCLSECDRVLRRGGILYVSTSNVLCPMQEEFTLPCYSWYPGFIKRYVVHLAGSSRPDLANYATYPAVHWFTYYGLKAFLGKRGFRTLDRFDIALMNDQPTSRRMVLELIHRLPPLRFLGHIASPGLTVISIKDRAVSPGTGCGPLARSVLHSYVD